MSVLPQVGTTAGFYVSLLDGVDHVIAIPDGATSLEVTFVGIQGASFPAVGRIAVGPSATPITGMTGTDSLMGYVGPTTATYSLESGRYGQPRITGYLHLASVPGVSSLAFGVFGF